MKYILVLFLIPIFFSIGCLDLGNDETSPQTTLRVENSSNITIDCNLSIGLNKETLYKYSLNLSVNDTKGYEFNNLDFLDISLVVEGYDPIRLIYNNTLPQKISIIIYQDRIETIQE